MVRSTPPLMLLKPSHLPLRLKQPGMETTLDIANWRGQETGSPKFQPMTKAFFDKYLKKG